MLGTHARTNALASLVWPYLDRLLPRIARRSRAGKRSVHQAATFGRDSASQNPEPLNCRLPDGFEDLAPYNLVTFKSHQQALDGWALNELVGHYVNFRKQVSPTMKELLPESDFKLFAVCVRFPQSLTRHTTLTSVQPGVYEARHFTGTIRIVVVHELPQEEHNSLLHLFSTRVDLLQYGTRHYHIRSGETSTLLIQLLNRFRLEAALMPDLLEQFAKDTIDELIRELPAEKRLELLRQFPAEKRLEGLSADELLKAMPLETRAALAKRLKEDGSLSDLNGH